MKQNYIFSVFCCFLMTCILSFSSLAQESSEDFKLLRLITQTQDRNQRMILIDQFLDKYPTHRFRTKVIGTKAADLAELERYQEAYDLLEGEISKNPEPELMVLLANIYLDTNLKLDRAEALARESVEKLKDFDPSNKPNPQITDEHWKKIHTQMLAYSQDVFGKVLVKEKKYSEAATILKASYEVTQSPETAQYLATATSGLGQNQAALKILDGVLMHMDIRDPGFLEEHKRIYNAVKGSSEGYEAYCKEFDTARYSAFKNSLKDQLVDLPAKDINITTLAGDKVTLESFKGKTLILNFWATWCGPCKRELPEFQKAYEKLAGDKVAFLAISTDRDTMSDQVKTFVKNGKYTFPVAMNSKAPADYEVRSIPFMAVIDGKGKLRYTQTGFDPSHDLTEFLALLIDLVNS